MKKYDLLVGIGLTMLLVVAATTVVAGDKVVINDDRKQPLKMVMVEPWYRQTVYSSVPIKMLKLELYPSLHINPGAMQGSSVSIEVIDANEVVAAKVVQSDLPFLFIIRKDVQIGSLRPGHYRVVARMFNSLGKPLTDVFGNPCEAQTTLFIASPAPQEVVFDRAAICRVNGKPFFPIAMYHYEVGILSLANGLREEKGLKAFTLEQWYLDARKMGLNSIHDDFNAENEESLRDIMGHGESMYRAGLRALANPPDYREGKEDLIQRLAKNPGLLGWYTFDEPTLNFGEESIAERVAPTYKRLREIDPYHPQFLCDNSLTAMTQEALFTDVMMPDFYPQNNGDMRVVGKAVASLKALNDGRAVVWPVIQAFQLPNYTNRPDGSPYTFGFLTFREMRAIVFDAVACGATGLSYYAYQTSEGPQTLPDGRKRAYYMLDDYPDQLQAITLVNQQLERLIPAVTSGELLETSLRPRESDAHVRAFIKDGKCYLLVVNPSRDVLDLRIGVMGLSNQTGRDLYSTKNVQLAGGYLHLTTQPLDVFVFVFSRSVSK